MSKSDRNDDVRGRLEEIAGLTNDEIIARSIASGVIFVVVLTVLDLIMSRPINIWQTVTLGMVFSGVLCAFDLMQRAGARRKLK